MRALITCIDDVGNLFVSFFLKFFCGRILKYSITSPPPSFVDPLLAVQSPTRSQAAPRTQLEGGADLASPDFAPPESDLVRPAKKFNRGNQ